MGAVKQMEVWWSTSQESTSVLQAIRLTYSSKDAQQVCTEVQIYISGTSLLSACATNNN